MLTRSSWPSLNEPSSSTSSTRTTTLEPSRPTLVCRLGSDGAGIVQRTACVQNFLKSPHVIHAPDHLGLTSEVHATDRPSPYCHCARMGSARTSSGASTVVALSLIDDTT